MEHLEFYFFAGGLSDSWCLTSGVSQEGKISFFFFFKMGL